MKNTIAVLLTCHNRKNKTLKCLDSFFQSMDSVKNIDFDIFLVDDGSTDGTDKAVLDSFPDIHIIKGNGNLYWNQGMRLAWNTAAKNKDYDFYLWLNDDTILEENAINQLISCYEEVLNTTGILSIISGACKESKENLDFSYGGRTDDGCVVPNGYLQQCKYINGNIVLVSRDIFNILGFLSNDYTHGMGDYDYGLRAQQNGFLCYTTKEYIATCPINKGIPTWCNPKKDFKERLQAFNSPRGLNIKEYIEFRKKFWPNTWIIYMVKAYMKLIFPALYSKIA